MTTPHDVRRRAARAVGLFLGSLLAVLGLSGQAVAQGGGTIVGRVTGPEGNPVAAASVFVRSAGRSATTDQSGSFRLTGVPAGAQTVTVQYVGFQPASRSVTVVAGATVSLELRMGMAAVALEGITVKGERGGQLRSINEQRIAPTVVNVVSADEIGQLPDQNVAEAVQRLSGVYVETDRGEGRMVSIRGTAPRLNTVTMNGQTMASAAASRATPLDLLPADMISGVEVTKAVTPDMDGNAVGGSINIKTLTAFDRARPFLNASLEGMAHEQKADYLGKKQPFEASMTAGRRFGRDGTLGVVVGGNASRRDFAVVGLSAGWAELSDFPGVVHPEDIEFQVEDNERTRYALNTSIDWRPRPGSRVSLSGLYTRTHELASNSESEIGFEGQLQDITPMGGYYGEGSSDVEMTKEDEKESLYGLTLTSEQRLGER